MSLTTSPKIAIIGAGLSGLALALALYKNGLTNITIYESRPATLDIGGAVMLSPNALKVLDAIGAYSRLQPRGHAFDTLYFRKSDEHMTLVDTFEFGSAAKYGYQALRIYRHELIDVFHELVREKDGISIEYGKKFVRVLSETKEQVTWAFADETQASASLLIGADGIHSQVRKYLHPDIEPRFTKVIGVTAAVPTAQLQLPPGLGMPLTLMNNNYGAFVIAKQLRDGSEVLIGKQRRFTEDLDREGWAEMLTNKQWCIDFLREGASEFPPLVANAVSNIPEDKINLWPFYVVPKLDSWVSGVGKVVILGDAAHAIPPTAGQGVNQAFEDVYTFAGVIGTLRRKSAARDYLDKSSAALKRWQTGRQERVDRILELNAMIDKRRLPGQDNDDVEKDGFQLGWLYNIDFDQTIAEWAA